MAYKEKYPSDLLSDAVEAIGTLPGVGRRSALRLALHTCSASRRRTSIISRMRSTAFGTRSVTAGSAG